MHRFRASRSYISPRPSSRRRSTNRTERLQPRRVINIQRERRNKFPWRAGVRALPERLGVRFIVERKKKESAIGERRCIGAYSRRVRNFTWTRSLEFSCAWMRIVDANRGRMPRACTTFDYHPVYVRTIGIRPSKLFPGSKRNGNGKRYPESSLVADVHYFPSWCHVATVRVTLSSPWPVLLVYNRQLCVYEHHFQLAERTNIHGTIFK